MVTTRDLLRELGKWISSGPGQAGLAEQRSASDSLSVVARIGLILLAGVLILWAVQLAFLVQYARSLAREVSEATGLDAKLVSAFTSILTALVLWVLARVPAFIPIVKVRSAVRPFVAMYIVTGLVSLGSYAVSGRTYFDPSSGKPAKYCIKTLQGFRCSSAPGFDPEFGIAYQPITPELAEELNLWKTTKQVKAPIYPDDVFFDPLTGKPVKWFYRSPTEQIDIFTLPGYHPRYGERLRPVTRDVVLELEKRQAEARRKEQERIAKQKAEAERAKRAAEQRARAQAEQERLELQRKAKAQPERRRREAERVTKPQATPGATTGEVRTQPISVRLTEIDPVQKLGYGLPPVRSGVVIAGRVFDFGLVVGEGTEGPHAATWDLRGRYVQFEAWVGVSELACERTSGAAAATFSVVLDGRTVYESPRLSKSDSSLHVRVTVRGARGMSLQVRQDGFCGVWTGSPFTWWAEPILKR